MSAYSDLLLGRSGIVFFVALDDDSGSTTVTDQVGDLIGTVTGVEFGTAPLVVGHSSSAGFVGTGNIDFGDVFDFSGVAPFTIEAIIAAADGFDFAIVSKIDVNHMGWVLSLRPNSNWTYGVTRHTGTVENTFSSVQPYPSDTTHHVVMTFDGTVMGLYFDGSMVAGPSASAISLPDTGTSLRIGDSNGAFWGPYVGRIGPVAIYSRAIDPAEVIENYLAAFPIPQNARPVATVAADSWTAVGAASLHETVDETPPSNTDYMESPIATAGGNEVKLRLGVLTDPGVGTGHVINYRYGKSLSSGDQVNLIVTLYRADGTTVVATATISNISAIIDGVLTLTESEANSIPSADYATGLVLGFKEVKV